MTRRISAPRAPLRTRREICQSVAKTADTARTRKTAMTPAAKSGLPTVDITEL